MEKQRIYTRPKTREDMFKLFEQVFYEVRHWFANGNTKDGIVRHIRNTFKKRPSDLTSEDLAMANEMTLEEWMEFAKGKYLKHLEMEAERMREKKNEQTAGKPTDPMDYPTAPLPPDYNKPKQTAIDFEKADNLERIAKALEALVEIGRERNELYREWLDMKKTMSQIRPQIRPRGGSSAISIKPI